MAAAAALMPRTIGSTRRLPSGIPCMLMAPVLISVGEMPTSVDPLPPAGAPGAGVAAPAPGAGACLPGVAPGTAAEEAPGAPPLAAAEALDPAGAEALAGEEADEGEPDAEVEAPAGAVAADAAADCGAESAVGAVSGAASGAGAAAAADPALPEIGLADDDLGPLPQAARMSAPLTMTATTDPARVIRIPGARLGSSTPFTGVQRVLRGFPGCLGTVRLLPHPSHGSGGPSRSPF